VKVLIVDDDLALADVLCFTMRRAGFDIVVAHDGLTALDRWRSEAPDLIVLDLNLPRLDGHKVCQHIRQESQTPIIMLTVRGEEEEIVGGLEMGADDYIVKPFSPRQLVARAEAVLRRSRAAAHARGPISAGRLTLDPARLRVQREDQETAQLTRLECRLLEALMLNAGQVVDSEALIDAIWGPAGGDRTMLKQLVYRLRQKLEPNPSDPEYVRHVSGVGYSFEA
jgi:DNA-binding response OmpR family regulator